MQPAVTGVPRTRLGGKLPPAVQAAGGTTQAQVALGPTEEQTLEAGLSLTHEGTIQAREKPRDPLVDAIKGVLIILVCLGHLEYFTRSCPVATSVLYVFHIPLFLAASCLFVSVSRPSDLARYVPRRSLAVVPLFVFWVTVYSGIALVTGRIVYDSLPNVLGRWSVAVFMANIDYLRASTSTGLLWFLPCLLVCNVLYALVRSVAESPWRQLGIAMALQAIVVSIGGYSVHKWVPWSLDAAIYVLPLCVGVDLCYRNRHAFRSPHFLLSVVLMVVCGGLIVECRIARGLQSMIVPGLWLGYLCDLFAMAVACSLYGLGKALCGMTSGVRFVTWTAMLGRHSLGVYLTHMFLFVLAYRVVSPLDAIEGMGKAGVVFLVIGTLIAGVAVGTALSVGARHISPFTRTALGRS